MLLLLMLEPLHFLTKGLDLLGHTILLILHASNIVHRFAKNLPFTGLEGSVNRQRISQLIKKLLHLLAPFPFGQLV